MTPQKNIVWLASYPKSGNTWLRALLANYFMPPGQAPGINELRRFTTADVRQDFFDRAAGRPFKARNFQDWLAMRPKALRLIAGSKPQAHFVKTHCQVRFGKSPLILPDVTAGAVYVMRNPFDVAPSYARHLGFDLDRTIDLMVKPDAMNVTASMLFEVIGRWDEHVASWRDAPGLAPHVVRYEDLLHDTDATVRGLLGAIGAPVDDTRLARAIEASSFSQLRRQEETQGFRERPPGMERFFASGRSGGWREALTPAQAARLRDAFGPTLDRHYPEILTEVDACT